METKQWFYYIRGRDHKPIVTVCLLQDKSGIARGMSICSFKEQPIKSDGRSRSKGRAIKALTHKTCLDPIRRPGVQDILNTVPLFRLPAIFKYKSVFQPILTNFEIELIYHPYGRSPMEVSTNGS